HGEAVAHGMRAALHLSQTRTPTLPGDRLRRLVERLPVAPIPPLGHADVLTAMQLDKKRGAGGLRFVLLDAVGHAYVADDVAEPEVTSALASAGIEA
ncbi:MAG TPA: 3-dehydroquinate synthase, partial [Rhodothermales bacterium]|nr:3-dehydroquinate synthase [Rhodothermales bacterium]